MTTAVLEKPKRLDLRELSPFPVLRFTLQQYWDLRDTGVLDEACSRYELLQGWIVPKMTQKPPDAWAVTHIGQVLPLPAGWLPRFQCAINTNDSEPEPDFVAVRGPDDQYVSRHPRGDDIGLLVEVADSTVAQDRRKAEIYAAEEIPVYWIINLVDRQIEVFTQPDAATGTYLKQQIHPAGTTVVFELDAKQLLTVPVNDLLPPNAP